MARRGERAVLLRPEDARPHPGQGARRAHHGRVARPRRARYSSYWHDVKFGVEQPAVRGGDRRGARQRRPARGRTRRRSTSTSASTRSTCSGSSTCSALPFASASSRIFTPTRPTRPRRSSSSSASIRASLPWSPRRPQRLRPATEQGRRTAHGLREAASLRTCGVPGARAYVGGESRAAGAARNLHSTPRLGPACAPRSTPTAMRSSGWSGVPCPGEEPLILGSRRGPDQSPGATDRTVRFAPSTAPRSRSERGSPGCWARTAPARRPRSSSSSGC